MKLYAVMFVWNEEDIIEATVKNAFAHGVDKVFLIDNGSTDQTISTAVKAGATHIHTVDNGYFDGKLKYGTVNAVIRQINKDECTSSIWWMILDADEFPDTQLGVSIRSFLESLDPDITVVAADLLDHLPTHPPYNIPGFHPIHFQPAVSGISMHKLPLLRYDAGKPHIMTMAGAHTYHIADGSHLVGTDHKILYRHFNYRKLETSLSRLRKLTEKRPDGTRRIDERDDYAVRMGGSRTVYWDRMEQMEEMFANNRNKHIFEFKPEDVYPDVPLWYAPEDIPVEAFSSHVEFLFWKAGLLLYSGNYADAAAIFTAQAAKGNPEQRFASAQAAQMCLKLAMA